MERIICFFSLFPGASGDGLKPRWAFEVFFIFTPEPEKSKLIWIANREKDTDVRQFFFPFF